MQIYDASVPVFTHFLKSLSAILKKAEAHCAAKKIEARRPQHVLRDGIPLTDASVTGAGLLWIRQDWMDKLGIKPPTSMADVLEISRRFTEEDPDGNGVELYVDASDAWRKEPQRVAQLARPQEAADVVRPRERLSGEHALPFY